MAWMVGWVSYFVRPTNERRPTSSHPTVLINLHQAITRKHPPAHAIATARPRLQAADMEAALSRIQPASRARHALRSATCAACASSCGASPAAPPRRFSALNRPPPNYPGHVPLTRVERAGLAIGSGVMSLIDPYRHGTASPHLPQA